MKHRRTLTLVAAAVSLCCLAPAAAEEDGARLVSAMLADTPIIEDLRQLTDRIGGRATGSEANERSVAWSAERFRAAGVDVRTEDDGRWGGEHCQEPQPPVPADEWRAGSA